MSKRARSNKYLVGQLQDLGSFSTGPAIIRYWYLTGDSGYPNRDAAAFSFPAVVFVAAFFPVMFELLGLVFVEFASKRG